MNGGSVYSSPPKPIVGVSSCLLGNDVRYDGHHKLHRVLSEDLARYFELEPYCPEVAIGMGVPRPPIRLTIGSGGVTALGVEDANLDVTAAIREYGREVALRDRHMSGFVFKARSPSCGASGVPVFDHSGVSNAEGTGLFAAEIMAATPLLPVIEESGLDDPASRENFMTRVYVFHVWRGLRDTGLTRSALIGFHARHKYLVMSRSVEHYRALGRMLADFPDESLAEFAGGYFSSLMEALCLPATRGRHANVLLHLLGYLKDDLAHERRQALARMIDDYRLGQCPLNAPLVELRREFGMHRNAYLDDQVYLHPYPGTLSDDA